MFIIVAGALLLLLNTKPIAVMRYMTLGGYIRTHDMHMFWFNKPKLLLHVIKLLLFFMSFVIANTVFFAIEFGPHSCFFSATGVRAQGYIGRSMHTVWYFGII